MNQAGEEASLLKCGRYASKSINIRILGAFSAPIGGMRGNKGKQTRGKSAGYLTRNYILDDSQIDGHLQGVDGGSEVDRDGHSGYAYDSLARARQVVLSSDHRPSNPLICQYMENVPAQALILILRMLTCEQISHPTRLTTEDTCNHVFASTEKYVTGIVHARK